MSEAIKEIAMGIEKYSLERQTDLPWIEWRSEGDFNRDEGKHKEKEKKPTHLHPAEISQYSYLEFQDVDHI